MQQFADGRVTLHVGDCIETMKTLPENSIDAIVTDPPYHLTSGKTGKTGFMGKAWDGGDIAFRPDVWREALRVLKPGGHMLAFGGTRTFHRLVVAIEDAGFEIRDMTLWVYGQGFPKSLDVSKAIGAGEQSAQWQGWGTAVKPALEPICVARKPLSERTVAANVLRWGAGAINIDACRVEWATETERDEVNARSGPNARFVPEVNKRAVYGQQPGRLRAVDDLTNPQGRWPANLVHDGSPEALAAFPSELKSGRLEPHHAPERKKCGEIYGAFGGLKSPSKPFGGDSGSAARFFYCAKASRAERCGSKHPTVKPLKLMRWLVRLVTPPGGLVLDPFAGTGPTAEAAVKEGFRATLIEREPEYAVDIARRLETTSAVGSRQSAVGASTAGSRATRPNHRPRRPEALTGALAASA